MKKVLKKILGVLTSRAVIVAVLLMIQLGWMGFVLVRLMRYSVWITALFTFLSLVAVAYVINSKSNPSVKLAWVVPILAFPLFGGLLYLAVGGKRPKRRMRRALEKAQSEIQPYIASGKERIENVRKEQPHLAGQMEYLDKRGYPLYAQTQAEYFPLGDLNYPVILEELKKAEHYIFLEYFIIQEEIGRAHV